MWRGSQRLAQISSAGTAHYHVDHLGTPRLHTNSNGVVTERLDVFPFGRDAPGTASASVHFTGHERDNQGTGSGVDDMDYMHARFYSPQMARFFQVDPVARRVPIADPQRWNRYVYAVNNPLRQIDPDGRDAVAVVFPDYRVHLGTIRGRNIRAALGHAGIVTIDQQGRTRYYEYGRYNPTRVRRGTIPDVQMGSSGLPTKGSLNRLMKAVSAASGQSGKAVGSYFINDQTEAMNAFAAGQEQGGRGDYSLLTNSCATFCADVLGAGGESVPGITIPDTFNLFAQIAADFVLTLESADENIECTGRKCPEEFEREAPAN